VALLYGQLAGAASLRDIVTGLQSHQARLYHLGARPVQRSTLADANAHRPPEIFAELFALMVRQANRRLRRALGDTVYLTDSTGLRLDRLSDAWARFSNGAGDARPREHYGARSGPPTPARLLHRFGQSGSKERRAR
jgi:hypothetical protein